MDLSMIVTNYSVFSEVQLHFKTLTSRLRVLNHPLQYLYDREIADEEDGSQNDPLSSDIEREESRYIPNEYCPSFIVKYPLC